MLCYIRSPAAEAEIADRTFRLCTHLWCTTCGIAVWNSHGQHAQHGYSRRGNCGGGEFEGSRSVLEG